LDTGKHEHRLVVVVVVVIVIYNCRCFCQIVNETFTFDRREQDIEQLKLLTREQVVAVNTIILFFCGLLLIVVIN
jgi:hypothetical protein